MPRRTLLLILATAIVSYCCYQRADRSPYGRYFAEVLHHIDRHYVETVDDQKLFDGAVDGMLGKLDGYSAFITRSETAQFQESLDQEFGGIGLELGFDPKSRALTVISPLAGTPAYKAGIHAGDRIVTIDGESTEGWDLKDAVDTLRGKPETEVVVGVARDQENEPLEFKLVRTIIHVDSVLGFSRRADGSWDQWLSEKERIGYLRITSFGEPTARQLQAAVEELEKHGLKALVIDLRNNPGGLLPAAITICDFFLASPESPIVTTRGREGDVRESFLSTGLGARRKYPLVVLVNRYSASASEIVAACLQDHDRADIVGERSFGKGTVQNVIPVEGGKSVLKLTVASYWRPSGKNIHRTKDAKDTDEWGVSPNPGLEVKFTDEEFTTWLEYRRRHDMARPINGSASDDSWREADPQLAKALDRLQAQLKPAASRATESAK